MKKVLLGSMILLAAVSFASVSPLDDFYGAYDHTETDLVGGSAAC